MAQSIIGDSPSVPAEVATVVGAELCWGKREVLVPRMLWLLVLLGCDEAPVPDALAVDEAPPVNPALAVGRTYVFDFAPATVVVPAGLAGILQPLLAIRPTERAFTVLGTRGGRALVRYGTVSDTGGGAWTQDRCALTQDVPMLDGPGDRFGVRGAGPLPGAFNGIDTRYDDVLMTGTLGAGARSVEDIHFRALADLSQWSQALGPVCPLVQAFGVACTPCTSGGTDCLDLEITDGRADWDANVPRLSVVTPASRQAAGCP